MSKLSKAIKILDKRIRTLEARLEGLNEHYVCYHEIREELSAMKTIRAASIWTAEEFQEKCREYHEERSANEAEMRWMHS